MSIKDQKLFRMLAVALLAMSVTMPAAQADDDARDEKYGEKYSGKYGGASRSSPRKPTPGSSRNAPAAISPMRRDCCPPSPGAR